MASIISAGTSTGTALNLTGDTSGVLALASNNGTTALTIDTSQNIGIGTTAPGQKFVVAQGTKATTASVITSASFCTTDSSPFGLFFRQKTDATSGNRWSGLVSFDNGVGASNLILQDLGGNVGIGVSSLATPSASRAALQISNSTSGGALYLSNSTTESNNPRIFGAGTTQYDLGLAAGSSTGYINFYTNGTERLRIPADSAGITFPATQAASTDPNTLDDYEEGSFTPTIAGANSYSFQNGRYTKIGNVVTYTISVNTANRTSSATTLTIGGLPFPFVNVPTFYGTSAIFPILGLNRSGATSYATQHPPGASYLTIYGVTTSSGNNYLPVALSDTGTSIEVEISGLYYTN